ncbi:polysaccharide deacetylase family protein [Megalodesulfovibrio paquesii]
MPVRTAPCALWRTVPADALRQARLALDRGLEHLHTPHCQVFFRADDCGVPGKIWQSFVEIFLFRRTPLAPALVPAWLSAARWRALKEQTAPAPELFAWHQHGRQHANYELTGKKMEFGPSRSREEKLRDLVAGRTRLRDLLGDSLLPVFTPPWNRVDGDTLELLVELEYAAISRSPGARPLAPEGLPDVCINVDLHTRKEPTSESAWQALLGELEQGAAAGRLGIMCHHQRMNQAALDWLTGFLCLLAGHSRLEPVALASRLAASGTPECGHPALVIVA